MWCQIALFSFSQVSCCYSNLDLHVFAYRLPIYIIYNPRHYSHLQIIIYESEIFCGNKVTRYQIDWWDLPSKTVVLYLMQPSNSCVAISLIMWFIHKSSMCRVLNCWLATEECWIIEESVWYTLEFADFVIKTDRIVFHSRSLGWKS